MTDEEYEFRGEVAIEDEEKKELVAHHGSMSQSCREEGTDAIETVANCCQYVRHCDHTLVNENYQTRVSRSNMIITSGVTRSNLNIFIATCTANLASVAAGSVLTWSSPTIPKITKLGQKVYVTSEQAAWLSSLVAIGASFGPFIASAIVNKIGRKWTIIADMFIFLISWSVLAYCNLIYSLYFARVLAGIAVGIVFTIVPMYVAEISPLHLRGTLGSLMQFFLCMGFLLSYVIGPYTSYLTLIAVSAAVPLLCILTFVWIPESPYHLLNKNRKQEALESLQWLRGYPERILMQSEITDMLAAADEARHNKGSIKVLFSNLGSLKALYYACGLAFFQQMSGINVVLFYAQTIFEATGSSTPSSISTIIIGVVMTFAAGAAAPFAKVCGVRNLLCISAVGEAISLGALGFYFYLKDNHQDVNMLGWLPVASLILFIIAYSIGFGPFVWVIMAEIFPAHLKAIASAVTASFCWSLCFLLTRYFNAFTDAFGQPTAYWMFSMVCMVALMFVVIQLPNTEGKSYQDIQEMITGKKKSDFSDVKA